MNSIKLTIVREHSMFLVTVLASDTSIGYYADADPKRDQEYKLNQHEQDEARSMFGNDDIPERDEPVLSARECDAASNAAWGTRLGQMEGRAM